VKVTESFVIEEEPEKLWEFFEQVDEVARCVPGVDEVEQIDEDNSKVRVTQAVGPMTATFDLKMRITEREPQELMQFTAIGRAVRGASGNVRSTNTVRLEPLEDGKTRVDLEADLAMGGMLGSVGQKVIAKQASKVTRSFADALQQRLGAPPEVVPPPEPTVARSTAEAPEPRPTVGRPVAAGVATALLLLFLIAWTQRRKR